VANLDSAADRVKASGRVFRRPENVAAAGERGIVFRRLPAYKSGLVDAVNERDPTWILPPLATTWWKARFAPTG
jgi:hypothetical protein